MVNWTKVTYIMGALLCFEIVLLIRKHRVKTRKKMEGLFDQVIENIQRS